MLQGGQGGGLKLRVREHFGRNGLAERNELLRRGNIFKPCRSFLSLNRSDAAAIRYGDPWLRARFLSPSSSLSPLSHERYGISYPPPSSRRGHPYPFRIITPRSSPIRLPPSGFFYPSPTLLDRFHPPLPPTGENRPESMETDGTTFFRTSRTQYFQIIPDN